MLAEHKAIADTIISQLGGKRFLMMTGAHNLSVLQPHSKSMGGVTMQLPANSTKGGINRVKVELTLDDTYNMYFDAVDRKGIVKRVEYFTDFYCDGLMDLFEEATGLYVTLSARRA